MYYDSIKKYNEHYDWLTKYDKDMLNKVYGFCYGLVNSGDATVADALQQYNCEKPECIKPIALSEVSQILNKSPSGTPKCSPETALLVQQFKRRQAEKDESEILSRVVSGSQATGTSRTNIISEADNKPGSGKK